MATGDQVAEHGVQPAGDLVTQPRQVTVPLSPHVQHRRVVPGHHRPRCLEPQRRDRHRQRIVRVVLICVTSLQQPHPGRQLRLNVQDPLAGGDELPVQQPAQASSTLHSPVRSGQSAAHATSSSA